MRSKFCKTMTVSHFYMEVNLGLCGLHNARQNELFFKILMTSQYTYIYNGKQNFHASIMNIHLANVKDGVSDIFIFSLESKN